MKELPLPSQAYLKELFDYSPEDGEFRYKKSRGNKKAGSLAGSKTSEGYKQLKINSRNYLAHRVAWMYVYNEDPGTSQVDHRDQCKDNNRINNLRLSTFEQNQWNRSVYKNNKLGVKGVYYNGYSYIALIRQHGHQEHIGSYKTLEEAGEAYRARAKELFGEFA